MRQRCEHGYVIDPADQCPECERDALRAEVERLNGIIQTRQLLMRALEAAQEADNYYVSADQVQAVIDLALEEAAKAGENAAHGLEDGLRVANAIRAMKEGK